MVFEMRASLKAFPMSTLVNMPAVKISIFVNDLGFRFYQVLALSN